MAFQYSSGISCPQFINSFISIFGSLVFCGAQRITQTTETSERDWKWVLYVPVFNHYLRNECVFLSQPSLSFSGVCCIECSALHKLYPIFLMQLRFSLELYLLKNSYTDGEERGTANPFITSVRDLRGELNLSVLSASLQFIGCSSVCPVGCCKFEPLTLLILLCAKGN